MQTKNLLDMSWVKDQNDIHIITLTQLCNGIIEKYPGCSIAISGSVGKMRHKSTSDLDLLVIDTKFRRNRQCVFLFENLVDINILCLSPLLIEERYKHWATLFNGQHFNYILDSRILYDPNCILVELKQRIAKTNMSINNSDETLLENTFKDLVSMMKIIEEESNYSFRNNYLNWLTLIINIWYLRHGIKLHTKKEHERSFEIMKNNDKDFYEILKNVIEDSSKEKLILLHNYVKRYMR